MLRQILFLIAFLCTHVLSGQLIDSTAKISLITCGQGSELYSVFGHTAIRVSDKNNDVVFNYGVFDFNQPNFYMNFMQGKLNYKLAAYNFTTFWHEYTDSDRGLIEQDLNLNYEETQELFEFLINNVKPENAEYLYDFLLDNCSSRVRDALEKVFSNKIVFDSIDLGITFRKMLYQHLEPMPWSKLGIDLLLGKRIDKVATPYQYMFLPYYLKEAVGRARIDSVSLVKDEHVLYVKKEKLMKGFFTPLLIFSFLALVILVLTIMKIDLKKFDFIFFLIIGLLGLLIVFMWFFTEHWLTKDNLNICWAMPLNTIAAFYLLKKQRPKFIKYYFGIYALICLVLLMFFPILPQYLNRALIPILFIIILRSVPVFYKNIQNRIPKDFYLRKL